METLGFFRLKIFLGKAPTFEVMAGESAEQTETPLEAFIIKPAAKKAIMQEVLAKLLDALQKNDQTIEVATNGDKGIVKDGSFSYQLTVGDTARAVASKEVVAMKVTSVTTTEKKVVVETQSVSDQTSSAPEVDTPQLSSKKKGGGAKSRG